jgi:hypothetical protein
MYIHGSSVGSKRGVTFNGRSTSIRDSYISGIYSTSQDSQAIGGWNGPGPFQISNNYLEAAGENVMFGGAPTAIPNLIPSDITITGNYFNKPLNWLNTNIVVKNLFELKNAQNVLIRGNIFENLPTSAQVGKAVAQTPRAECGTYPAQTWVVVKNLRYEYNIFRNVNRVVGLTGYDTSCGNVGSGQDLTISQNLFYDVLDSSIVPLAAKNITIEHNTMINANAIILTDVGPTTGLVMTDNLAMLGTLGIWGSGYGSGFATLDYYFPGYLVNNNAFVDGAASESKYPAGNFWPATADVGWVNPAADDYRLQSTSPYLHAATDGTMLGADVQKIMDITANVISGGGVEKTYSIAATPTSITPEGNLTVSWTTSSPGSTDQIALFSPVSPIPLWSGSTNGLSIGTLMAQAPSKTGQYVFRYLVDKKAVASSVPVTVATIQPSFTVVASTNSVAPGEALSVTFTADVNRGSKDWVGLFSSAQGKYVWTTYTNGAATGTYTIAAPATEGQYQFIYNQNDSATTSAKSQVVTVAQTAPTGYSVIPSLAAVSPGTNLTISWTADPAGVSTNDYIGLYPVGGGTLSAVWTGTTSGAVSGSRSVTAPTKTGTYEFRYMRGGFALPAAISVPIAVNVAVVLKSSATKVRQGNAVTVTWSISSGSNSQDSIILCLATVTTTSPALWTGATAGAITGSISLTAPAVSGRYVFRYIAADGKVLAESSVFTVF